VPETSRPPSSTADTESDSPLQLALLAAIVESSDDAIVSKTLDGRILSWNAGAQRIFGYRPEEAIGQSITLIIPTELHAEERRILEKLRQGERIDHFDTIRVSKDGRRIPISLTVSPVRDSRGKIVAASKVARDISDRKRAEQALREREEALREADRRKDQFLALVAHELRNPLAPIRYALATWRKPGTTPEQRKRAEEIFDRQLTQMARLLDDLLDIARITRHSLELKKAATDLKAVMGVAVETARPLLDAKQHTLELELPQPGPSLQADAGRLAQVFSNLLINAAKYTDPGGRVRLSVVREGGQMVFSVSDNGIGIAPDMLPRVFDLFAQADTALERAQGGLGVGLALVRGLVHLHGGSIEARSEGMGCGCEFIVRLPLDSAPAQPGERLTATDGLLVTKERRVLIVADEAGAAEDCAMFLGLHGHLVQIAQAGYRALELGPRFHPDVVLLDIGLPDIDGYELARTMRTTEWGASVTLVALTGWGQEEDRQRAFQSGFDYHLTKPLQPERIETLLQAVLPAATCGSAGPAA